MTVKNILILFLVVLTIGFCIVFDIILFGISLSPDTGWLRVWGILIFDPLTIVICYTIHSCTKEIFK